MPMCACLSMRELVSLLNCDYFAMLLRTYIDDSADETQEKAVVAGAYVGFYHQWNKLQTRWKARLKRDGIKYFRSSDYYSLRGEFSRFKDSVKYPKPQGSQAAAAMLNDLESIIQATGVMGLAVCVDMAAYREIRANKLHAAEIFPEDAFEMAVQWLIKGCAELVRDEFKGFQGQRRIAFVCDESSSAPRISRVYSGFKAVHSDLAEYMAGLVHQDDQRFPQLQAADLMAHLAKGRFIDWLNDPNGEIFTSKPQMRKRLERLSVHYIAAWNREHMLDVLANEIKARGLTAGV
jgi:hypothetical protein